MFFEAGYYSSSISLSLTNWDVSKVTNMSSMFRGLGRYSSTWTIGDLSNWKTGKVTNMSSMFNVEAVNASTYNIGNLNNWDVSKVTNMSYMFAGTAPSATTWNIGNLSNWNTSSVTNMASMFNSAGSNATNNINIGSLKIYATNTNQMFINCKKITATINIYNNITSYDKMFSSAAIGEGSHLTINYSSNVTNIDNIIATKSDNSNVVKGSILDN
jgi:surface protein